MSIQSKENTVRQSASPNSDMHSGSISIGGGNLCVINNSSFFVPAH